MASENNLVCDPDLQGIINNRLQFVPMRKSLFTEAELIYRSHVIENVACYLSQLCIANKVQDQNKLSLFDSSAVPEISIHNYLIRIVYFADVSTEALIHAISHIDHLRYIKKKAHAQDIKITVFSLHRILITAITICKKFYDDINCTNSAMAQLGGVSLKELNLLEVEFLVLIEFDLTISQEKYVELYTSLSSKTLHRSCNHNLLPPLLIESEPIQLLPSDDNLFPQLPNDDEYVSDILEVSFEGNKV